MSTLEQIVRPATVNGIRPLNFQVQRKAPKAPAANIIVWGSGGNDVFSISAHVQQDVKNDLPADEIKRTYDQVKVMNPDDNEQHVTVEAMTEYQARNQIDKSRIILRFFKQEDTENVKVQSRGNVRKGTE